MRDLIQKHKIFVCAGSGGVGKTTVSSSIALLAASMGKKVLLFTIDPSRRLATCLGLDSWNGEIVSVKNFESGGVLYASMVDHKKIFDEFVKENSPSKQDSERMLKNRLYKELSTNLNGSQEFTSLRSLQKAVDSKQYDFIVLDTPPAQHTLDFVKAPQVLFNLFSGPVVEWFRKLTQKKSGILSILSKGTQAAVAVLEKITGAEFITELQDFFVSVSNWSPSIQNMVIQAQKILMGQDTAFLIITNLDEARIIEAQDNIKDFKRLGFSVKSIVVNRMTPDFELMSVHNQQVIDLYQNLKQSEAEQVSEVIKQSTPGIQFYKLPKILFNEEELAGLVELSQAFKSIEVKQ